MKYLYYTEEVLPDQFSDLLEKAGRNGWEYVNVIIMQRMKAVQLGQPGTQVEIKFLTIFKKIDTSCQE